MKRISSKPILYVFLFLVTPFLNAQTTSEPKNSIGISFQKIDIGQGMQLDYGRRFGSRWQVNLGLYFHFNTLRGDDQNYEFHNRGWAENGINHLGANFSIDYAFIKYQNTRVYCFYNANVSNTSLREKYYDIRMDPNGDVYYVLIEGRIYGPTVSWENSVGLGVSTNITKNIGFFVRGGLGVAFFYNPEGSTVSSYPVFKSTVWEAMHMYSTGFYFTF